MDDDNLHNALPPQLGVLVLALDRGLKVTAHNEAGREVLGQDLELGAVFSPAKVFEGPSVSPALAALDAALYRGHPSHDLRASLTDAEGKVIQCVYEVIPQFDLSGQVGGVVLTMRDLAIWPQGDDDGDWGAHPPHLPHLNYQTLLENLAEGVFTVNVQWRITSFNHTAERLTGYRREEVLGRRCWEIFRSDLCQQGCPMRLTLETGLTRIDQDVRMISKGGKQFSVLTNTSVIKNRQGQLLGAVETFRLVQGREAIAQANGGSSYADIIGRAPAMRRLFAMLPDIAASEANVLITGESGTGKELFAQAIHQKSARSAGPFVAVNCSALAESLLESELFGHEKAAFTGAVNSKVGRFELAKGGTLFLDEIGELRADLQVKLLRVLEKKVIERVGGSRAIPLDTRIIAATNRNLAQALEGGGFREDLYYRLRTVHLNIPPLRQRPEDIEPLVKHFIAKLNQATGKRVRTVDPKVLGILRDYSWPGNVRELERAIEHAFVFVKGPVIFPNSLPSFDDRAPAPLNAPSPPPPEEGLGRDTDPARARALIDQAMRASGGRKAAAAELLGVSRTSLWRWCRRLGLS